MRKREIDTFTEDESSRVGPSVPRTDRQDLPQPASGLTETLLKALVLAWDADDEKGFVTVLTIARAHLGVPAPVERVH